jgi:UPF0042 nucleotide-binding protein
MRLIIISGRSGSGKSTALHQLEDEGFYCIDNLPAALLPALVEQAGKGEAQSQGIAVCIDARNAWKDLHRFPQLLDLLPADTRTDILFLDADDSTLIKRFSETRRRHPLSDEDTPLAEAIVRERHILEPISISASLSLDTSQMTIHELRSSIRQRLVGELAGDMSILFQSFGFKRGLPTDADLVFDARVLPNPHWEKSLRVKTGRDPEVARFLEQQEETEEFYADIAGFLDNWLPRYHDNNRSYITVAIGCTGGQHRSVYLTERLFKHYGGQYPRVHLRHRELQNWAPQET